MIHMAAARAAKDLEEKAAAQEIRRENDQQLLRALLERLNASTRDLWDWSDPPVSLVRDKH